MSPPYESYLIDGVKIMSSMDDPISKSWHNNTNWSVVALALAVLIIAVIGVTMPLSETVIADTVNYSIASGVILLILAFIVLRGRGDLVDTTDDAKVFETLEKRAAPAIVVEGTSLYRCPSCEMSFDPINAVPEEENVVLCPFCSARLYLEY